MISNSFGITNNKPKSNNNQAKKQTFRANLRAVQEEARKIPYNLRNPQPNSMTAMGILHAASDGYIEVLNTILTYKKNMPVVYARADTLAKSAGVSLSTFKRACDFWELNGFMTKKNNGYNKTCWYKPSTWFKDKDVQKALAKKLTVFYFAIKAYLSASLLMSYDVPNVFNFIYKNKQVPNVNTSTYEEREYQRKIKKGNEVSTVVDRIAKELKLENYEISQLSNFSDDVLQQSYKVLSRTKNVLNKYRFLLGCCKNIQAKSQNKPVQTTPKVVKEVVIKKVEEKKYTAMEMANEISKILQMPNNAPSIINETVHQGLKEKAIRNLLYDNDPVLMQEEGEDIALMFIKQWKDKLFPVVVEQPKKELTRQESSLLADNLRQIIQRIKPESTTLNENDLGNTNTQPQINNSATVNFDDDSNYEEVYD